MDYEEAPPEIKKIRDKISRKMLYIGAALLLSVAITVPILNRIEGSQRVKNYLSSLYALEELRAVQNQEMKYTSLPGIPPRARVYLDSLISEEEKNKIKTNELASIVEAKKQGQERTDLKLYGYLHKIGTGHLLLFEYIAFLFGAGCLIYRQFKEEREFERAETARKQNLISCFR